MFPDGQSSAMFADSERELARLRVALAAAGDAVYEWNVSADRME